MKLGYFRFFLFFLQRTVHTAKSPRAKNCRAIQCIASLMYLHISIRIRNTLFRHTVWCSFVFADRNCYCPKWITLFILGNHSCYHQKQMNIKLYFERVYCEENKSGCVSAWKRYTNQQENENNICKNWIEKAEKKIENF